MTGRTMCAILLAVWVSLAALSLRIPALLVALALVFGALPWWIVQSVSGKARARRARRAAQ